MAVFEDVIDIKNFGFIVDLDWEDIRELPSYKVVDIKPGDDLMDLSYRYYGSVDLWWCIYYFNNLSFPLNCIVSQTKSKQFLNDMRTNLIEYPNKQRDEQMKLEELVRNYFLVNEGLSQIEAVVRTKDFLGGEERSDTVLNDILTYMESLIIDNIIQDRGYVATKIKIPDMSVVYEMLARVSEFKRKK
jgi:hypothetical protein